MKISFVSLALLSAATAQVRFEVASIHECRADELVFTPEHPMQPDSIGVFINPGQVVIRRMTLNRIVSRAFGIVPAQITGAPNVQRFLSQLHYDIRAKIPEGVSQSQVPEMLRSLLEERFNIRAHQEQRMVDGYLMSVGDAQALETARIKNFRKFGDPAIRPPWKSDDGPPPASIEASSTGGFADVLSEAISPTVVAAETSVEGPFRFWVDIGSPSAAFDSLKNYGLRFGKSRFEKTYLVVDSVGHPSEN
ncbi:MAG TPA: TIGR03435 family protein [Bryobacteraceae bacterium]|nr:TIGR03435 family protein [Bryobacteraceae bacterium]